MKWKKGGTYCTCPCFSLSGIGVGAGVAGSSVGSEIIPFGSMGFSTSSILLIMSGRSLESRSDLRWKKSNFFSFLCFPLLAISFSSATGDNCCSNWTGWGRGNSVLVKVLVKTRDNLRPHAPFSVEVSPDSRIRRRRLSSVSMIYWKRFAKYLLRCCMIRNE